MKKPFWKQRISEWGIVQRVIRPVARTIGNTAGGDNKVGESIHGILDLFPIPNQPIGKFIKAVLSGNWNDAKAELSKVLTLRNAIAVGVTVAISMGWITLEDVKNWMETLNNVSELINNFLAG